MSDYKLMKHSVKTAFFAESFERVKKNNLEIEASGNISIPKNEDKNNHIMIKLKFRMGKEDERLYLTLETLSVFGIENDKIEINEDSVRKECLPMALANLRKTVKMVTEAYGMPALELPPFEGENA